MLFKLLFNALLLGIYLLPIAPIMAEDGLEGALDCADPVESGRRTIKDALGILYNDGANAGEIKNASRTLDGLVTNSTYCQVFLQSQPEHADRMLIAEWRSLHQWLNRIADTLHASVSNPSETRWRDEYSLFAEVYEFTP